MFFVPAYTSYFPSWTPFDQNNRLTPKSKPRAYPSLLDLNNSGLHIYVECTFSSIVYRCRNTSRPPPPSAPLMGDSLTGSQKKQSP